MLLSALLENQIQGNVCRVCIQLLKQLRVPVTRSSVINTLEAHPDFPSLYCITDSLKKWKTDAVALQIENSKLDEIPVPFIAHLEKGKGFFTVITKVTASAIWYLTDSNKQKQKDRTEFLKEWSHIVVVAEPAIAAGEKDYAVQRRKEIFNNARLPFILLAASLLVSLFAIVHVKAPVLATAVLLLIIKLAGCLVTCLLLWFEIDKSNAALKRICIATKNTNCTAILGSRQAKLFNRISWSEIGFFYFAGSFLFLLVNPQIDAAVVLLSWLNGMAIPYTLFSVIYQWKVAKQWCPLCLTVQAILISELIVCYVGYWDPLHAITLFSSVSPVAIAASFSLPVLFWVFSKQILLKAHQAKQYKREVGRLKYNKDIFASLLSQQKPVHVPAEGLGIILGNPNASNTIIKVCNPYCGPCAGAHPVIDEIIERYTDVKVQIIFTATDHAQDISARPVKHLMALYEKADDRLLHAALDDWYMAKEKDYTVFAEKYILNGELEKQGARLSAMSSWCDEMKITFTPTFFINGRQLPQNYTVQDLKYLLDY